MTSDGKMTPEKNSHADLICAFMQTAKQPTPQRVAIPWAELSSRSQADSGALEPDTLALKEVLGHGAFRLHLEAERFQQAQQSQIAFRVRLILEETAELLLALARRDTVEVADALADLEYVVVGTAVQFGIPHDRVFAEVHRSNMSKFVRSSCTGCNGRGSGLGGTCPDCEGTGSTLKVRTDAQGKVIKSEQWTPPDIRHILDPNSDGI